MIQFNANDSTQVSIHQLHHYVTEGGGERKEGRERGRGGRGKGGGREEGREGGRGGG